MNEQVIKEMIELAGGTRLEFDDLMVKMSPHTWPVMIERISLYPL
jgi:hypothetical protein